MYLWESMATDIEVHWPTFLIAWLLRLLINNNWLLMVKKKLYLYSTPLSEVPVTVHLLNKITVGAQYLYEIGLSSYKEYAYMVISSWGLIYPLSEHVDIFPVRPVSTFPLSILRLPYSNHLSYMVVFYPCGRNKRQGLDPFMFSIKDSLHIHKWHGTFYYRDTTAYIMTIPSSPCRNCGKVLRWY